MVPTSRQNPTPELAPEPNPNIATIIAQQLQNIIHQIVTQVTTNANNANGGGGNDGNNGCSYKTFTACNPKEFDGKGGVVALTRWIKKMESLFDNSGATATQPTTIQIVILTAGILTNEAVRCGTLTKRNDKRKETEESSKQGSPWKDSKKSKTGQGFVAKVPPSNDNPEIGHYARQCWVPIRQVVPVNTVKIGQNQRACYECGSLDHLRYDCPKWKQATGQTRNPLDLEGNRNTRNNRNQERGGAFNGNAIEAPQDPKVMMGTFSLNNQFDTVLFNSEADFNFISTKFVTLLNVEPCIVNPRIADGKSVEVDRVIRDWKLELGNSLFTIDLIPLGHGSFDVIMGMDWLSKNKHVIVCSEKVAEIPIKEGGILCVHRERALGAAKALMNAKVDKPRISDIPMVREFTEMFSKDLLGLPPQRQIEFRIDLVPVATLVSKSP
uniref:CCHC-type domain-containing protein n=1 Tax=Tanacetum cinerariifolium TaxID=118510 RepID=A0A699J094_TANCI|nr:hypothetical protein [Tanacetum cinerariifolium]